MSDKELESRIRNKIGIIDPQRIAETIKNLKESGLSFEDYFRPIHPFDFMPFFGKTVKVKDKTSDEILEAKLIGFADFGEKKKGKSDAFREHANAFGTAPMTIPFPVPADLQLRFEIDLGAEEGTWTNGFYSYNELAGLCNVSRKPHTHDFCSKELHEKILSDKDAVVGNMFHTCSMLRSATQDISDLLKVGDIVETSYGTGPYTVIHIGKHIYTCDERPEGANEFINYSLHLSMNGKKGYYINNLVPYNGKLLKLFVSNEDETTVVGFAEEFDPSKLKEDEEDEDCDECSITYEQEKVVETTDTLPVQKTIAKQSIKKVTRPTLF